MILCVPNVLGPQELATVRAGLRDAGFADGSVTSLLRMWAEV